MSEKVFIYLNSVHSPRPAWAQCRGSLSGSIVLRRAEEPCSSPDPACNLYGFGWNELGLERTSAYDL